MLNRRDAEPGPPATRASTSVVSGKLASMCGRYASIRSRDDLTQAFGIDPDNADEELPADFNVAPTKIAPAVLARPPRHDRSAEPVRQLRNLTWGLVPSWAKDPKIGNRMINARAETVAEKPAFRRAFASRRLLIPASGFYEWFPVTPSEHAEQSEQPEQSDQAHQPEQFPQSGQPEDATPSRRTRRGRSAGKPRKQPFYIRPKDPGGLLTFAGLYEFWRDDTKPDDDPAAWLVSFTIITTRASDDVGHLHDRMPMTVAPENWAAWLDPRTDTGEVRELMAPPAPGSLDVYPVSTAVNNARNNGPELVEPLPPDA